MDTHSDITDEAIVREIQNGNNMQMGVLIDRYEKRLARYIARFTNNTDTINDLVQDVFIKSYVNIQSFDTAQKFSSWIYRIAHNESVNFLKKKKFFLLINFFKKFFTIRKLVTTPLKNHSA